MRNLTKLIAISLIPAISNADSIDNAFNILSSLHGLTYIVSILLGIFLLVAAAIHLKNSAEQSHKYKVSVAVVMFLCGALMLNSSQTLTVFVATFSGEEYCTYFSEEDPNKSVADYNNKCWDSSNSEVTKNQAARIERVSGSKKKEDFLRTVSLVFAFFQLCGFIYFIKGVILLKDVAAGTERGGYGKPIVILIASSLLVDSPHTVEILLNTLEDVGARMT